MTKPTKLTTEETLENVKQFQHSLHGISMLGIVTAEMGLFGGNEEHAKACAVLHDVSHALDKVIKGLEPDEVLKQIFGVDDEEDEEDVEEEPQVASVAQIAVNVKTGDIEGIENIKNPKIKQRLAGIVQDVADKLGGK